MNQPQSYMEHAPASAPGSGIGQYSYGQPQALQPATQSYPPNSYGAYQYPSSMAPMAAGHPVTSSMGSGMVQQALPLPTMASSGPPGPPVGQQFAQQHTPDTSGQIAPPGMKPRVTATLWEDEGSLCFQVEAKGVCVARREDNHMINGTKLLNVAGMTRGRRDGILKSEKTRHVVKIGPMHLKGVWIPFDRALDFANKERITELLYPLFVHNIGALLYHPTNQARQGSMSGAAMAARRPEQQQPEYMRTPTSSQPPTLTHHHSMSNSGAPQPPHSMAPHPASGRPGLDRAHTFPTPPASASSMTMNMGNSGSSYEYGGQPAAMQTGQHLPHPAVVSRPLPTSSLAATSPGGSSQMQYPTTQAYDGSRSMYSAGPTYPQYPAQYSQVQAAPGVKTEMAPPARAGAENEAPEHKAHDAYSSQHEGDGEHEGEYTHTSTSYGSRKASYAGLPNAPLGQLHSDPSQISPEMNHSPHQNGSGRATPRTTATYPGYSTPQRSQLPASNLYNVISNDARAGAPNGADTYQAQGYAPQYSSMNGVPPSNKRGRDVDDEDQYGRPLSANGIKRARTDTGAVAPPRPMPQQQPVKPIR